MRLDRGIASFFRRSDGARPAETPKNRFVRFYQSYYGELSFETNPANPTEYRDDVQTDARIRVLQCREIARGDAVLLEDADAIERGRRYYTVSRAYHGEDERNGRPITDVSLQEVRPYGA